MDNEDRMRTVANSTISPLVNFFAESAECDIKSINEFCSRIATHTAGLHDELTKDYLTGVKGAAPASPYLNKTKGMYEYIRKTLGVKMHGYENYTGFVGGLCVDELSIGENISIIYEVSCLSPSMDNHLQTFFRPSEMARCKMSWFLCSLPESHWDIIILCKCRQSLNKEGFSWIYQVKRRSIELVTWCLKSMHLTFEKRRKWIKTMQRTETLQH